MKALVVLMASLINVSVSASSAASSAAPAAVTCKGQSGDGVVLEVVQPRGGDSRFTLESRGASFSGKVADSADSPGVYTSVQDPRAHFVGSVQRDHAGGSLSVRGAVTVHNQRTLVHFRCL